MGLLRRSGLTAPLAVDALTQRLTRGPASATAPEVHLAQCQAVHRARSLSVAAEPALEVSKTIVEVSKTVIEVSKAAVEVSKAAAEVEPAKERQSSLKRSRSSEGRAREDEELARQLTRLTNEINEAMRASDRSSVALLMRQRDQLRAAKVQDDTESKRTRLSTRGS
jgi:hypothetical protein